MGGCCHSFELALYLYWMCDGGCVGFYIVVGSRWCYVCWHVYGLVLVYQVMYRIWLCARDCMCSSVVVNAYISVAKYLYIYTACDIVVSLLY